MSPPLPEAFLLFRQQLPRTGPMVTVLPSSEDVKKLISDELSLSAIFHPNDALAMIANL